MSSDARADQVFKVASNLLAFAMGFLAVITLPCFN